LDWAKNTKGGSWASSESMIIDASSNSYIAGSFSDTVDFDPSSNIANLYSIGYGDIFVAKYDINGNYIWAINMGSIASFNYPTSIKIDDDGDIYITGYFYGTIDFDPSVNQADLTSFGSSDIFIAKYDNNGNYIWAKNIGGLYTDNSTSLIIDKNSPVITGKFFGSVDFDPSNNTTNLYAPFDNMYIAKYDSNGIFIWVKQIGGGSNGVSIAQASGVDLKMDITGNIYTTGIFYDTIDFDPSNNTANLVSLGDADIFIAKYDPSGNYIWAKNFGGNFLDYSRKIALDIYNNLYVVGSFENVADFDPSTNTVNLISLGVMNNFLANYGNAFLAKYDPNGNYIWAINIAEDTISSCSNDIIIDGLGNPYVIGYFESSADFDPSSNAVNLVSAGLKDIFLAKYDANSNYNWAIDFGGPDMDVGNCLALENNVSLYASGNFNGNVDFDPSASIFNLFSGGLQEAFITKYNINTIGINENNITNSLSAFPNPTSNIINVNLNQPDIIEIYTVTGTLIKSTPKAQNHKIDVSTLSNGMYFLKADDKTTKFVKN